MNRAMRVLALTAVGLLCLTLAARAGGGAVQGQVHNGTAGAVGLPEGLRVQLYIFAGDTLKDSRQAVTDAQGMFRFEAIPTGNGLVAVAAVEYEGVVYESELLDLAMAGTLNGDVAVYEVTTEDAALSLERSHLVIEMGVGQLEVTEVLTLLNSGDRTYVGAEEVVPGRRATARALLPVGATDISLDSAEAVHMVRTGDSLVDTRPITPGSHQYRLSYVLPCDRGEYDLSKRMVYPTVSLDMLIAAPGARIEAPGFAEMGTRETTGVTYVHYHAQDLARDDEVTARLTGLGQPARSQPAASLEMATQPASNMQGWLGMPAALAGLALLSALGVHAWRERAAGRPLQTDRAGGMYDALLLEMAELDEGYAANELEGNAYRMRRQAAKEHLWRLMAGSQDVSSVRSGDQGQAGSGGSRGDGKPGKAIRSSGRARRRRFAGPRR